jgi:HD superfamily phosphohydrolase
VLNNLNKKKIFNDPIYGFITLQHEIVFNLIDHPYFQRLRRIKQLGLSHLVYPGALHTRFHHAMGAMYLMQEALDNIRSKGHEITEAEAKGATIAILLHDIGHGPFSHALEHTIVDGITHEHLSAMFMDRLNDEFDGQLSLGIKIFKDEYKKKFLHQLVSSQLDMDRLDYLKRDSFYSGVSEGVVSSERIIKMLNVVDDQLVVESKGIYSIEKFLVARRLMYWQVYLHKAVVSAETMLVKILQRAKELADEGKELFCSPSLHKFIYNNYGLEHFAADPTLLHEFSHLDDYDIMGAIKVWQSHEDPTLAMLSTMLVNRKLLKIEIQNEPITESYRAELLEKAAVQLGISRKSAAYFVITASVKNNLYDLEIEQILILMKNGEVKDIATASDDFDVKAVAKQVTKYFVCYPK